jgi:hypothetical protein
MSPLLSDKRVIWLAVAGLLLVLAAANAHLVFVSVTTQPACVDQPGAFHAAASACPTKVQTRGTP